MVEKLNPVALLNVNERDDCSLSQYTGEFIPRAVRATYFAFLTFPTYSYNFRILACLAVGGAVRAVNRIVLPSPVDIYSLCVIACMAAHLFSSRFLPRTKSIKPIAPSSMTMMLKSIMYVIFLFSSFFAVFYSCET